MSALPKEAVTLAHVLVLTVKSHALETLREMQAKKDAAAARDDASTCLDSLVKQLELVEDVLAGHEIGRL
jgi:hypothetical protein